MKKLLTYLNEIYSNEKLEKQYLVYSDNNDNFFHHLISDDVSDLALNSSYSKFKEAIASFNINKGIEVIIVHNHPNGDPRPSLMDFKNSQLFSFWSSINSIPIKDYLIFSSFGYYSFLESSEWKKPSFRYAEHYETQNFKLPSFDYKGLLQKKSFINKLLSEYNEILLANNKIYYSCCLPLEKILKEIENETKENIYFTKREKNSEGNILLINNFLKPIAFIEVSSDGGWEAIF